MPNSLQKLLRFGQDKFSDWLGKPWSWFSLGLWSLITLSLVMKWWGLLSLPVFADEAIYIRWAQLIIDDWQRYLFFPLNDGKTPLFVWLLVPGQALGLDPLWAGRLVSVVAGLIQAVVGWQLIKTLGGGRLAQAVGVFMIAFAPYWYLHHYLALMDGWLVVWLSISLWLVILGLKRLQMKKATWIGWVLGLGLSFGLGLWTKLPAVLFIPILFLGSLLPAGWSNKQRMRGAIMVGVGLSFAFLFFLILYIQPAFGQLFARGGDFLYSPAWVFGAGGWRQTLPNTREYLRYFMTYLTPGFMLLLPAGLFARNHKRSIHFLFWGGVLFLLPVIFLGKVVYPRYLLPGALLFTLAGALSFEALVNSKALLNNLRWKLVVSAAGAILLAHIVSFALPFGFILGQNPAQADWVDSDRSQYLSAWSAGYGLVEIANKLETESKDKTIAVATEGFFGTLPDGLIMYFYHRDVSSIYIEGVGVPVSGLPSDFLDRAVDFDEVWLVVNSNRLRMDLDPDQLIDEFCRPFTTTCLQVWQLDV